MVYAVPTRWCSIRPNEYTIHWEAGASGASFEILDNPKAFDLTTPVGFALALNEVRRLKAGGCCVIALCCESFSAMYLA